MSSRPVGPEAAPGELDPVAVGLDLEREHARLVLPVDAHGHVAARRRRRAGRPARSRGRSSFSSEYPRCRRAEPMRSKAASTLNMSDLASVSRAILWRRRRSRARNVRSGPVPAERIRTWPSSSRSPRAVVERRRAPSAPPGAGLLELPGRRAAQASSSASSSSADAGRSSRSKARQRRRIASSDGGHRDCGAALRERGRRPPPLHAEDLDRRAPGKRRAAGQEEVPDGAEREDVRARVHLGRVAHPLRRHVERRPEQRAVLRERGVAGMARAARRRAGCSTAPMSLTSPKSRTFRKSGMPP